MECDDDVEVVSHMDEAIDDDDANFENDLSYYYRKKISTDNKSDFLNKALKSTELLEVADRLNLSDRDFMMIASAFATACEQPIENLTISYSTIRKRRIEFRKAFAQSVVCTTSSNLASKPLVVHWDGKLMANTTAG
jgi:hypothetical protein